MTVELHPPTGGVHLVSSERCTIKYSSMKSGVFPCALYPSPEGANYQKLYSYPNCGPVHEQNTHEQLLSPPEIRV